MQKSGVDCSTTRTCSEMETSLDELHEAVKQAVTDLLSQDDVSRIMCDIHLDCRRNSKATK